MTHWRRNCLLLGVIELYLGVIIGGMALPFDIAWLIGMSAMIFYTQLMRPPEQWLGATKFPVTMLVFAALVAILVYVGSWLATKIGVPSPYLGPALAIGGVVLSRLVWSAAKARELDAFLAEALAQIETPPGPDADRQKAGE